MNKSDNTHQAHWMARHRRGLFAIALACITPMVSAVAQTIEKDPGPLLAVESTSGFEFQVDISKTQYTTGESVNLTVEGSEPYFLYVFSEDLDTGEKTLLLPNARQTYNAFPADSAFTVPDKTVTFSRDTPGKEQITVVASTHYVPLNVDDLDSKGDFFTAASAELDDTFGGKGLIINTPEHAPADNSIKVQRLALEFVEEQPEGNVAKPEPENSPMVFITSSCSICEEGQAMKIGYTADRDGVVTVLLIEPEGDQTTLLRESVTANAVNYVSAIAEAPLGAHTLVALYGSDDGDIAKAISQVLPQEGSALPASDGQDSTKGLSLVKEAEPRLPHGIRHFTIVR